MCQSKTDVKWSSRWDYILKSLQEGNIQWFQIINALVIVLFMTGMIAMILLRTLHRDISRYNQESVVRTPSGLILYLLLRPPPAEPPLVLTLSS